MDEAEWMAAVKERHVFKSYGGLMTRHEQLAYSHLIHTLKAEGYAEREAQGEEKNSETYLRVMERYREGSSQDPSVLLLHETDFQPLSFARGKEF